MNKKVQFSIRLTEEQIKKLDILAEQQTRTRANLVESTISDMLKNNHNYQLIREIHNGK